LVRYRGQSKEWVHDRYQAHDKASKRDCVILRGHFIPDNAVVVSFLF
jgi:hypothetical protein